MAALNVAKIGFRACVYALPGKVVLEMTYTVSGEKLNPINAQNISLYTC